MRGNTLVAKKITALTIVRAGLLIAMSLVLKVMFEIYIPLAGIPALRINFASIPIMLCGIICGPTVGFLSGGASDLINFMFKPGGGYFPGFTLVSALSGMIPGLIYKYMKKELNFNLINSLFISLLTLGFIGVFISNGMMTFQNNVIMYNGEPLGMHYILGFLLLVASYILIPVKITSFGIHDIKIDKIVFIVSVTQLVTSIILNTYFLSLMYGKGFLLFLPARILTNFFMIPLYSIIISTILNTLGKRLFKITL